MNSKVLFFALFFLLNLIFKAWYAGNPCFNYDEIISVKNTFLPFGHIKHEAEWDNNPPFYYYCLWVWHKLLPITELNSRLLSVIFVSLAIAFTFLFGDKYFGRVEGIVAALMLSLSNFWTFYAQETRAYALIAFLVIVSSFLFFRYLSNNSKITLIFLSVINFLIVYTHYIASIVIVWQVVVYFVNNRLKNHHYYWFQALIVGGLILIRFTKKQFIHILEYNKDDDFWLSLASWSDLINALDQIYFNRPTAILFVFLHVMFLVSYLRNPSKWSKTGDFYLGVVGLGSVLVLFGLGLFKAVFLSRYLIFVVPFSAILAVRVIKLVSKFYISICIILLIVQFSLVKIYKESNMDYRGVANLLKMTRTGRDAIIINTSDNLGLFLYYYQRSIFYNYRYLDSVSKANLIYPVNTVDDLPQLKEKQGTNIFLVQSFHKLKTNQNEVKNRLENENDLLYTTEYFNGVEFSVFHCSTK